MTIQVVVVERDGRFLVCRRIGRILTVEVDCPTMIAALTECVRLQASAIATPQVWSAEDRRAANDDVS